MANGKGKEKLKKFIENFIKPILRGTIKSLPFGNAIIEATDNIKSEMTISKGGTPKRAKIIGSEVKAPFNWISILIQTALVAVIIYAFVTKQITIEQVIQYFSKYESVTSSINDSQINLTDTIQ